MPRSGVGAGVLCAAGPSELDVRWARREEARALARLFLLASQGLAAYLWSAAAAGQRSLEDVGAERYARDVGAFSYANCLVAVRQGTVVGMVQVHPMIREARGQRPPEAALPPYAEPTDPGSLFIAGLAVYGRHRERGVGTRLLEVAYDLARRRALARVSLLCSACDARALRFLRRRGFREIARWPTVAHAALRYGEGEVMLLARTC